MALKMLGKASVSQEREVKREKEKRNEAGNGPWVLGRTEEGIGIKSPILLRAKPILCYFYIFFTEYIFTYIFSLLAMSFVPFSPFTVS